MQVQYKDNQKNDKYLFPKETRETNLNIFKAIDLIQNAVVAPNLVAMPTRYMTLNLYSQPPDSVID